MNEAKVFSVIAYDNGMPTVIGVMFRHSPTVDEVSDLFKEYEISPTSTYEIMVGDDEGYIRVRD